MRSTADSIAPIDNAITQLIRALAKKAARDHMQTNPNRNNGLHPTRAKRVGLKNAPPLRRLARGG